MEKIFVDGYVTQDIDSSVPAYILGKGAFKVENLIKFLEENKKYAVNGYLNFVTKRSKEKGTRYTVLDLYQFNKTQEKKVEEVSTVSSVDPDTGETIDMENIPF